MTFCGQFGDM